MRFAYPLVVAAGLLCALPAAAQRPGPDAIVGKPLVLAGDTVRIGSTLLRLYGIATPGKSDLGGLEAAGKLAGLVGSRELVCRKTGKLFAGAFVAHCELNGQDLSELLIRRGLALDCPAMSGGAYAALEYVAPAGPGILSDLPQNCLE
jgi:endonuclease YncB( thermonuclease family)